MILNRLDLDGRATARVGGINIFRSNNGYFLSLAEDAVAYREIFENVAMYG